MFWWTMGTLPEHGRASGAGNHERAPDDFKAGPPSGLCGKTGQKIFRTLGDMCLFLRGEFIIDAAHLGHARV